MQSKHYFDLCTRKLAMLACEVELRGSLNILDLHVHCENFYARLLNLIFGYSLKNMNAIEKNSEGIDLVDHEAKIVLQVSSTATRTKVQNSLNKDLSAYAGYRFKFVSISKDASELRNKVYKAEYGLVFQPVQDIVDVKSIAGVIQNLEPSKQHQVYSFIQKELPASSESVPSETNIAALIKILGAEDLSINGQETKPIPFGVDNKIIFNQLNVAADLIEHHKIYHHRIDKLYASFDEEGQNKSTSVLYAFNSVYLKLSRDFKGDDLFFEVIQKMMDMVQNSANYFPTALEELEFCINILAVDAFLRCKIFRNPKAEDHVAA